MVVRHLCHCQRSVQEVFLLWYVAVRPRTQQNCTTLTSTVHLRPSWMSGASVVSARSACHKKDIYGKTFVHPLFAMAGHFVAAGCLAANTPSREQRATFLCEWHVARCVIPPCVWSSPAVWLSQCELGSCWDSAFASFGKRP